MSTKTKIIIGVIIVVFFIGRAFYLKTLNNWKFDDAKELYDNGKYKEAKEIFWELITDDEFAESYSRAYISACDVYIGINKNKGRLKNKKNWINLKSKEDTIKSINNTYKKVLSILKDEDLSFSELFTGKDEYHNIEIIPEKEQKQLINELNKSLNNTYSIELSEKRKKELSNFQQKWIRKIYKQNKGFIYKFDTMGLELIYFTLGKLASDPPQLFNQNDERFTEIFTNDYKENIKKDLGDFYSNLPIKISIVKHPYIRKKFEKWISPSSKMWTGVKLYSGNGATKKYVGVILGGSEDKDGDNTVVLKGPNNIRFEILRYDILKYAYFIKKDDPALLKEEWYEYK